MDKIYGSKGSTALLEGRRLAIRKGPDWCERKTSETVCVDQGLVKDQLGTFILVENAHTIVLRVSEGC